MERSFGELGSGVASLAARITGILRWSGGLLFCLAAYAVLLSISWDAPDLMLVAAGYGGSALLFVTASTTLG
jgi:hypothetical protein